MKTKKLCYAMVGGAAGSFIGPIHRAAIRLDNLATLVAGVFSRDAEANAATAAELSLPPERVYSDWRKLIDAEKGKIDFLVVCTPNSSHFEIARAALEAGMNVMCEKPLSLTLEEAETLERIARRRRLLLAIPFTYLGAPMVKLARDLVKNGELGKICKVHVEYVQGGFRKIDFTKPLDKRNRWKMNPKESGPSCVVADIGVHGASLIEYITGLKITKVLSDLSSFAPGNRLDDDASIIMHLERGAKAAMVTSKVATGEENGVRVRVYGDKASLYWNQEDLNYLYVKYPYGPERIYKRKNPYVDEVSATAARASRIPAGHHEGFIEAFANHYDEFCRALRGGKDCDFPSAREGVRTMKFVESVLASAKAGGVWTKV
jgi:predicted dehydrogenase